MPPPPRRRGVHHAAAAGQTGGGGGTSAGIFVTPFPLPQPHPTPQIETKNEATGGRNRGDDDRGSKHEELKGEDGARGGGGDEVSDGDDRRPEQADWEGHVVRFTCGVDGNGFPREAFVFRTADGTARAFVNECAHQGVPLDWEDGDFFEDESREVIRCKTHGAKFTPRNGTCFRGPCKGKHLLSLPVEEREDGRVVVRLLQREHMADLVT